MRGATRAAKTFTATVCDFTKTFTAQGSGGGATVVVTFTPTSANAGPWTSTGSGTEQAGGESASWLNPLVLTPTTEGC